MKKRKLTLYVQSARNVYGIERWGRWGFAVGAGIRGGGYRLARDYKAYSEAKYESVLPGYQKKAVEVVKTIAQKYDLEVKIVDVTNENIIRKIICTRGRRIKTFPTLISDTGERVEGKFTEEKMEQLLKK